MMTASIIGAALGLAIGIADFFVLGVAARSGGAGRNAASGPLKIIRLMSLFVFPIVGWFIGPIVADHLPPMNLGG